MKAFWVLTGPSSRRIVELRRCEVGVVGEGRVLLHSLQIARKFAIL